MASLIVLTLVPVAFVIALGWLAGKWKILDASQNGLLAAFVSSGQSGARRVTDGMILAAARALGSTPRRGRTRPARCCPPCGTSGRWRGRSRRRSAWRRSAPGTSPEALRDRVAATRWAPEYPRAVSGG